MEEIENEWKKRARRIGVTAVMSARHSEDENEIASEEMKNYIINFLEKNYGSLKGKRILELGCGIGRFTRELGLRSKQVVAVDMTAEMIKRAEKHTNDLDNVKYIKSKIISIDIKKLGKFDLVFETIVLLHILDDKEYRKSLEKIKSASDNIFICEHMDDNAPVSKFSKLRKFEDYEEDFKPFKLVAFDKDHYCVKDWFPLMLFRKQKGVQ